MRDYLEASRVSGLTHLPMMPPDRDTRVPLPPGTVP